VYCTTLFAKLLSLVANKISLLDPWGMGIEMEAGKPNWFDSLNGLPALFGSSTCETFELKRLLKMIKSALEISEEREIGLAGEIANFVNQLSLIFNEESFSYWDKSNALKQDYRYNSRMGFSGNLVFAQTKELLLFVNAALEKVEIGLAKAFNSAKGTYHSYFINEVTEYDLVKDHYIKPRKFAQTSATLFLEGQMHALRLSKNANQALGIYKATRKSALFDKKLNMYKVTASLSSMPEEIGRCRIFTPGWLENESIWLHMEYKYLLEALKHGLYEEFYADFRSMLIPFQKGARYGRSILENSSFLVSSAFPDKNEHGNGYVARLSGSTAEFLQIWLIMNTGLKPFILDNNHRLNLRFEPALPGWLFDAKGKYSFNFLSKVAITYHNPKKKNTFGPNKATVKMIVFQDTKGNSVEISQGTIPHPYAELIRSRQINKIDIFLG
jgi:hypothetical protein